MSTTNTDQTIVLDTGRTDYVRAVAFHPDGMHLLSGNHDGVQRWRFADGQEVGRQVGMDVCAICVSRDHKWIVCGTTMGASVWDGEMHEKVINVEGTKHVVAIDVSPDSTRFAIGTGRSDKEASVWSMRTGERLVGPLQHDDRVTGIKFTPDGERIATASSLHPIRIFDSRNGDELIVINTVISERSTVIPLAWSSDSQRIFSTCNDDKIRVFDSTGSQITESLILNASVRDGDHGVHSIALAANGKFIATATWKSISFLDTSTLKQIGPVIKESKETRSIAISADSRYLATGQRDGNIVVQDLSNILPGLYGPFPVHVPTIEEVQQLSTSSGHDNEVPDAHPAGEDPAKSIPLEPEEHSEDGDGDLLEQEALSSVPPPESFNYDESLSLASSDLHQEDEVPPVGSSRAISQSSGVPPAMSSPEAYGDERLDTVKSSQRHSILKKWLSKKSDKDPSSHKLGDRRSPSGSPARVDATNEGPSWMAAGKRKRRAVAKTVRRPQGKPPAKAAVPKNPNEDASRSRQVFVDPKEAGPVQQATIPSQDSQPSAGRVHVMRGSSNSIIAIKVPNWMMCFGSGTDDGTHGAR